MTTRPELNRILAVLRSPELGFLGFVIPVLRQTPFISGLFESAGERPRRARCSLRQPRRTWLYVAATQGVEENLRVVSLLVVNVFVRILERIEDEGVSEVVDLLYWIVEDENCRVRMGCRTLIVDLGMTIILWRSRVREHRAVAMLVI